MGVSDFPNLGVDSYLGAKFHEARTDFFFVVYSHLDRYSYDMIGAKTKAFLLNVPSHEYTYQIRKLKGTAEKGQF